MTKLHEYKQCSDESVQPIGGKGCPPLSDVCVMRVFVRLPEMKATHKELAFKLIELEERLEGHDEQIQNIFEAIRQLMTPPEPARKKIGFVNEPAAKYGRRKSGGALH